MANTFVAKSTIRIQASTAVVWDALTNPQLIKQYLFGTQVESNWKEGSSIVYRGEWQGKTYEDKGTILKIEPEKLFSSTYWSSMSGKEDKPENYNTVTYTLASENGDTVLTVTQDNVVTEQERDHSQKNWDTVLAKIKELTEKK